MLASRYLPLAASALLLSTTTPLPAVLPTVAIKAISTDEIQAPTSVANAGDGSNRLFICDQRGQIRIIQAGTLLPTPFLDISSKIITLVSNYDERGLLGLAFHPDYKTASAAGYRKFYVFYTTTSPNFRANPTSLPASAFTAGNPVTITTATAHGLTTGNWVTVNGVTGGSFTGTINALHSVTVVNATQFTVPVECTSTAGITGGSISRANPAPVNCRTVISEFQATANPNIANFNSERVLLAFDKPQSNHNGGQLEFGPDGYLYFSTGDGGGANDTGFGHNGATNPASNGNLGNAQDKTSLLGKIHRIDPLGNNGPGGQYGIPATNPFATTGGGVRPEIYAYGLRNTWRFSFDTGPGGTGQLFAADLGQNLVEEVDIITAGGNYGWRAREGGFTFDAAVETALVAGGTVRTDAGPVTLPGGEVLIDPIAQYAHPTVTIGTPALAKLGVSICGGYVYRGSAIPELVGKYVFGDWSANPIGAAPNGVLLAIEPTGPSTWSIPATLPVTGTNPIPTTHVMAMGRDEAGEIYVATQVMQGPRNDTVTGLPTGAIYKLVPVQVTTSLTATKDNSIFSEDSYVSAGAGYLFAGQTGQSASYAVRRALVAFGVGSRVPYGSTVTAATLQLKMNLSSAQGSATDVLNLHRVTEDWGQGTSNATTSQNAGGTGAPATPNDATWAFRIYPNTLWTTAGGSFFPTVTATLQMGLTSGLRSWSSPQLLADVQGWVNQPGTDFGWLIKGNESSTASARRFDSSELPATGAVRPALLLTYTPPLYTRREEWVRQYFNAGRLVADTGDLDRDGIVELLEYAYAFSPATMNNPRAGTNVTYETDGADSLYSLSFRRDPRATDLTYVLETSPDLVTWTTQITSVAGGVPTGPGYLSENDVAGEAPVKNVFGEVYVTNSPRTKFFTRLRVTRTP